VNKLGVIGHLDRPQIGEATKQIIDWCSANNISIQLSGDLARLVRRNDLDVHDDSLWDECDIIISLGGDGSMLYSAQMAGPRSIPVLGINLGGLGFLTELTQDQIPEGLQNLRKGNYRIEERTVLQMTIPAADGPVKFAFNDVVIHRGDSTNLARVDVYSDDEFVCSYDADGIIVATPTGSTAYSLSVGGPIIDPLMEAITVSPISPHTLTLRPIIFPADKVISIAAGTQGDRMSVSLDGRNMGDLEAGRMAVVKKAGFKAKFVKFESTSYYEVLRKKLHWGMRPLMNK
jgi:NAD+ kinase